MERLFIISTRIINDLLFLRDWLNRTNTNDKLQKSDFDHSTTLMAMTSQYLQHRWAGMGGVQTLFLKANDIIAIMNKVFKKWCQLRLVWLQVLLIMIFVFFSFLFFYCCRAVLLTCVRVSHLGVMTTFFVLLSFYLLWMLCAWVLANKMADRSCDR